MPEPGWSMASSSPGSSVRAGSKAASPRPIGRGADLRVYTEFLFEEHILPGGNGDPTQDGLIREVIDFRETILVGGGHVGAITTQRQPLEPPFGFNGTEPRMSFFMYTSDGDQALAGLVFGGVEGAPAPGERTVDPPPADMPKMGPQEYFDLGTSGPSRNFVYDMETYRYFVRDDWEEILAHDADGRVTAGSFDALEAAQIAGREIKVGIRDLAADLGRAARRRRPRDLHAGRVGLPPHPGRGSTPRSPTRSSAWPARSRCATGPAAGTSRGSSCGPMVSGGAPPRAVHRDLDGPAGALRLPLVRTVNRHQSGPPDQVRNQPALKASCNLRPMLISHCPWSREGL